MEDKENKTKLHHCKAPKNMVYGEYGIAIDECWQKEQNLWVGKEIEWTTNGEYSNIVKFCPFCGFTLKK